MHLCNKNFCLPSRAGELAKKFYGLLDVSFPSFLRNRPHCESPFEVAPWGDLPSVGAASRHVAGYA